MSMAVRSALAAARWPHVRKRESAARSREPRRDVAATCEVRLTANAVKTQTPPRHFAAPQRHRIVEFRLPAEEAQSSRLYPSSSFSPMSRLA